jgi:hypothetical protein
MFLSAINPMGVMQKCAKSRLRQVEVKVLREVLNVPKGPGNAYSLYYGERFGQLRQHLPLSAPITDVAKQVAQEWRSLPLDQKQPYLERAKQAQLTYQQQRTQQDQNEAHRMLATLLKTHSKPYEEMSEERARQLRLDLKTYRRFIKERPMTGKGLFLRELLEGKKFGHVTDAFRQWQSLPAEQRTQYERRAEEQLEQYKHNVRFFLKALDPESLRNALQSDKTPY